MGIFGLDGKRILVTGASSGIGRACAKAFSELGAKLVLSGRDEARLDGSLSLLSGTGHVAVSFDLGDSESIESWMSAIAKEAPLDGLVHCAGIMSTKPMKAMSLEEYRRIMAVNADSAFALAKAYRRRGVHASASSLVFISSIAGIVGESCNAAYSASKAALLGMCRSLAMELVPDGVRVNCVLPGYVKTEMFDDLSKSLTEGQKEDLIKRHPLGLGAPEDVAYAAAYLLSDASRWVTGSSLIVDGGYSAR